MFKLRNRARATKLNIKMSLSSVPLNLLCQLATLPLIAQCCCKFAAEETMVVRDDAGAKAKVHCVYQSVRAIGIGK